MGFGTWDRLVLTLVPISFIVAVAAVLILRPLSKRLGELLVELRREKNETATLKEVENLQRTVVDLGDRLERLEERHEFMEGLLGPSASPSASARVRRGTTLVRSDVAETGDD